jgi:hypothetical protein
VETGWVSNPTNINDWVSNLQTHFRSYDVDGVVWTPAPSSSFTSQRTADLSSLTKPVYYVVRIAGERSNRDVIRASALCS